MGIYVDHRNADITIPAEQIDKTLEAINTLGREQRIYPSSQFEIENKQWDSLEDALADWGWKSTFNEDGDLTDVAYTLAQKETPHTEELWNAVAQFVTNGSFIEVEDMEGPYRYVFGETEAKVIAPEVIWDDPFDEG